MFGPVTSTSGFCCHSSSADYPQQRKSSITFVSLPSYLISQSNVVGNEGVGAFLQHTWMFAVLNMNEWLLIGLAVEKNRPRHIGIRLTVGDQTQENVQGAQAMQHALKGLMMMVEVSK